MTMTSPLQRIEALEAGARRVATAASLLTLARATGIPVFELEAEVDRVLVATPDYSHAERIEWLSNDSGIPVAEIQQGAAAILAECRNA